MTVVNENDFDQLIDCLCFQVVCICACVPRVCEHCSVIVGLRVLGEFHQIYNFGALWDRDELVRFWVKRSKVKVMTTLNEVTNGRDICIYGFLSPSV